MSSRCRYRIGLPFGGSVPLFFVVNACIPMIRVARFSLWSSLLRDHAPRHTWRAPREGAERRGRAPAGRPERDDASREGETLIELSHDSKTHENRDQHSTSQSTYCRLPTRVVHACQQSGHSGARGAPRLYTQALEAAGPDTRPQLITQRERRPPATAGPGPCMSSSLSSSEASSSPGAARHQLKAIEELGPAAGCEVAEAAE